MTENIENSKPVQQEETESKGRYYFIFGRWKDSHKAIKNALIKIGGTNPEGTDEDEEIFFWFENRQDFFPYCLDPKFNSGGEFWIETMFARTDGEEVNCSQANLTNLAVYASKSNLTNLTLSKINADLDSEFNLLGQKQNDNSNPSLISIIQAIQKEHGATIRISSKTGSTTVVIVVSNGDQVVHHTGSEFEQTLEFALDLYGIWHVSKGSK